MPLTVGIITRTKDRTVLLKRAIETILQQDYQDWYHVIVNDGGDAQEVETLVSNYKDQYKDRIKVVHNPQSVGMEAASNIGINNAGDVKYLIIHDDDDSWYPNFLSKMTASLQQAQKLSPTFRAVICHSEQVMEEINGNVVIEKKASPYNNWLNTVDLSSMFAENRFPPISFLFERDLIEEIGMFNENLPVLGDWDFHLRVLQQSDIFVLPEMLARYHHRYTNTGAYSNSVVGGVDKHRLFRSIYVNEKVRDGLNKSISDVGQNIIEQEILNRIQHAIWGTSEKNIKISNKIKKKLNNLFIFVSILLIMQVIILLTLWF